MYSLVIPKLGLMKKSILIGSLRCPDSAILYLSNNKHCYSPSTGCLSFTGYPSTLLGFPSLLEYPGVSFAFSAGEQLVFHMQQVFTNLFELNFFVRTSL